MKYLFTLIVLFITLTARSQEYLNWQKFIYGTAEKDDSATAIEVMDDEVMIAGNVNNAGTGKDVLINKYTPDGTLVWSGGYVSSFGDEVKSFQCNYHDFTFAAGSTGKSKNRDGLVFALDDKGNSLWAKTFNGSYGGNDEFTNLKIAPDSSIIVVGESMISGILCSAIVVEYDQAGNKKWSKVFGSTGENEFNNIEFDNAGNIFVSGYVFNGIDEDGVIAEYSSAGKFIKSVTIKTNANTDEEVKALELENGLLYAAIAGPGGGPHTTTTINAYDPSNFKIVWSQTYGDINNGFSIAGSFQCNLHGDLLITGVQDNGTHKSFAALSYNALTGAFNWASIIGPEISYNYQAITNTLDATDNLVITGIKTPASISLQSASSIYTVAVDSKGATVWTKEYDGLNKKDDSPSVIGANKTGEIYVGGQSQVKDQNGIISNDMLLLKYSDKEICSVPTDLSLLDTLPTSVTLSWDAMPEAVKYRLQYRVHKIGTWITVNTKTNSTTLTNLTPGTEYDWKVETICSNSPFLSSGYSQVYLFKTAQAFTSEKAILNNESVKLWLYPNPASKLISLHFNGLKEKKYAVEISDVTGRLYITQVIDASNNYALDISSLLPGPYMLTLRGNNSTYNVSFIKQ